jgi:acyl-CoA hydrolase
MTETGTPNSVTLRFLAAPMDVGHSGSVDAGTVLEWVDKAAYATAVGWAKSYCVTAYVGNIHFADPVNSGDMVEVEATIVYTGRSQCISAPLCPPVIPKAARPPCAASAW